MDEPTPEPPELDELVKAELELRQAVWALVDHCREEGLSEPEILTMLIRHFPTNADYMRNLLELGVR